MSLRNPALCSERDGISVGAARAAREGSDRGKQRLLARAIFWAESNGAAVDAAARKIDADVTAFQSRDPRAGNSAAGNYNAHLIKQNASAANTAAIGWAIRRFV